VFGNWGFIDVFTPFSGVRQSFSNFYLKYDYSLDRKIVSPECSIVFVFVFVLSAKLTWYYKGILLVDYI
jgi:hypothetical protein